MSSLARAAGGPLAARAPHFAPRAKRVIFLFIQGGPSQLDLFDPKPLIARKHGEKIQSADRRQQGHDRRGQVPGAGADRCRSARAANRA